MSELVEQLNEIEAMANQAMQQENSDYIAQLSAQLSELQSQIVEAVTADEPTCDVRMLTTKYADVQGVLEKCRQQCKKHPVSIIGTLNPPPVSVQSAQNLSRNVKVLRDTISEMHSTIQDTQNATEISFYEVQDRREIKDISAMAVNSVKATLYVQNYNLKAENRRLRDQVEELLFENQEIKKANVELRKNVVELENFTSINKKSQEQLQVERQRTQEDIERLQAEVLRYQSKFNNLNELYKIEMNAADQQKQENLARISYLEAENDALTQANLRFTQRNAELEDCDMDSASIEIARAAQTIKSLNSQIDELKNKLMAYKAQDIDKTQALKATIAAIHEGDYEYVENVVTEKEDLMAQLNYSRNEIEALKSKLTGRRTVM